MGKLQTRKGDAIVSRDIWFDIKRKRVLKRAETIKIVPKLSVEVEIELKALYQMEKEG